MKKLIRFKAFILCLAFVLCSCGTNINQVNTSSTNVQQDIESTKSSTEETDSNSKNNIQDITVPTETTVITSENTFENNDLFEIVEKANYQNIIKYNIIIFKVLAKKDCAVSTNIIAYDENGNAIGKSSDDIILTKDKYNYFRFSFENDISNANFQASYKENDSLEFLAGERNAVEMIDSNRTEHSLYLTLKQTGDTLGFSSKFKLLFYKDNNIIDTEDTNYLSVCAENLNGKGSTDVAEISIYGKDFDRFEYIYEP